MFPFVGIWGKLKILFAGLVAMLLPILYVLGRRDGANIERTKALKEAHEVEQDRGDFYEEMEQEISEIESNTPRGRDGLAQRLREHGL